MFGGGRRGDPISKLGDLIAVFNSNDFGDKISRSIKDYTSQ